MLNRSTTDTIVRDAQSFQTLLTTAESEDPIFAKALLGNVSSVTNSHFGAVIAGVITAVSTHYGFGWSVETVGVVSTIIMYIVREVIQWVQIFKYRRTLPVIPPLPDLTKKTSTVPQV